MTDENDNPDEDPPSHNGIVDPDQDTIDKWSQDQKDGTGSPPTFDFLTGTAGVPIDEITTKRNENSPLNDKFYDDCLSDFKEKAKEASACYDGLEAALNSSNAPGLSDGGSGDETTWGSEKNYEVEYSGTMEVDVGDAFPMTTLYGTPPDDYTGPWQEGAVKSVTEFIEVSETSLDFEGTYSGALPSSPRLTSTTQTGGSFKIKVRRTNYAQPGTFYSDGSTEQVSEFEIEYTNVNANFVIGEDGSFGSVTGESDQSDYIASINGTSCVKEQKQATSISWQKASFAVVGSGCGASIEKSFTTETKAVNQWGAFSDCGQPFDETQVAGAEEISNDDRIDLASYNNSRNAINAFMQDEADKFDAQTSATNLTVAAFECLNDMITNITGGEEPNYGVPSDHPEHPTQKPWFDNMVKAYDMLGYSYPPDANESQDLNGTVIEKLLSEMLNTDSGVKGTVPTLASPTDVTDDML